jgi:YbgC/YbaW family acyl-CoA thioester hydrolase
VAWGDFRHRVPLRVRWAEVDRQGVVFNAHYLLYCDVCVTEYWRAVGLRYPDDFEPLGTDLYVRRATVDYRAAALYDDELDVCGRIARLGGSSLHFAVELYRRAQTHAVPFYRRHGYVVTSGEYLDCGIPHVDMQCTLATAGGDPPPDDERTLR